MPKLTAISDLPAEAIGQLEACGILTAEMLAGIPVPEIHRVLELTAWKKGRMSRAPSLAAVQQWADLARALTGMQPEPATAAVSGPGEIPAALARTPASSRQDAPRPPASIVPVTEVDPDDIPEAIVLPRSTLPARSGYAPPSQRARLEAAGTVSRSVPALSGDPPPPVTADIAPVAAQPRARQTRDTGPVTADQTPGPDPEEGPRFATFQDYQSGNTRVNPLNRFSIDGPTGPLAPEEAARSPVSPDLPRTVRRGVVHPNPVQLIYGAMITLLWRLALLVAVAGIPWLLITVPQPSDYKGEIGLAALVLLGLGIAQLIVMNKVRCRICTCHLFFSRNTVKNRKAHSIPLFGKTASLALHLLLFQWFRCMYCGTAIKLWTSKNDEAG